MSPPVDPATASELALHPDHLADLRRSGLTDATISAAGIQSLAPADFVGVLGIRLASAITSALLIPYPEADGFERVKLFPPVATADGGTIRYFQPVRSAPRLYLPPRARSALTDPSVLLVLAEGEKKSLAGDQAGLACVGLGGLWNWLQDGRPITDLGRIDHVGRAEWLVPDSDTWTRPDLLQPVYALGRELESRGARVMVVKVPAGPEGTKCGLDDYLVSHSSEDFHALPRLTLKDAPLARLKTWHKAWVARKTAPDESADAIALLQRGELVRILHPAQDVLDGVLWYGVPVPVAATLVMISSDRRAVRADALPRGLALRHTALRESSVSSDAATAWSVGATGSVAGTLDALALFLRSYVVFADPRTPMLLAAWTLGTWSYRAFRIYPYLSIRSPEKRCGKSRLLAVLRHVAFNASPVTAIPTEAQLFRGAASTGGAQLFDEVDGLRGDKERFDALIAVLNVGFERGGVVTRLEKRGETFEEQRYEVYAPRVLAGLKALKETLADRAIPIFMTRKRRDERVARLTAKVDLAAAALRDGCALASLSRITDILAATDQAPSLLEREQVDDRASDLWAPLIALGLTGDAEDGGDRTRTLLTLAKELSGLRDAEADDSQIARLVEALTAIRETAGDELVPEDLRAALAARPEFEWVTTTKRLAGLLNPLGFVRRRQREGGRLRWVYVLEPDRLADLAARYGSRGEPA
jgi:Domain of unknown function (DUF3854)/Protein of unknown function (DUF3631)